MAITRKAAIPAVKPAAWDRAEWFPLLVATDSDGFEIEDSSLSVPEKM